MQARQPSAHHLTSIHGDHLTAIQGDIGETDREWADRKGVEDPGEPASG